MHSASSLTSLPLLLRDPIALFTRYMLVLSYGHNLQDEKHRRQAHGSCTNAGLLTDSASCIIAAVYLVTVYSCLLRHQLIRACLHLLLTADDAQRDAWLAVKQHLRNYNIDAVCYLPTNTGTQFFIKSSPTSGLASALVSGSGMVHLRSGS